MIKRGNLLSRSYHDFHYFLLFGKLGNFDALINNWSKISGAGYLLIVIIG